MCSPSVLLRLPLEQRSGCVKQSAGDVSLDKLCTALSGRSIQAPSCALVASAQHQALSRDSTPA